MCSMYKLRHIANAKLNLNLFRMLVVPSYTLLKGVYYWLSNSEKKLISTHFKKMFKLFMVLPKPTPDNVILLLAGDIGRYLTYNEGSV
jgi:hypothetical protein